MYVVMQPIEGESGQRLAVLPAGERADGVVPVLHARGSGIVDAVQSALAPIPSNANTEALYPQGDDREGGTLPRVKLLHHRSAKPTGHREGKQSLTSSMDQFQLQGNVQVSDQSSGDEDNIMQLEREYSLTERERMLQRMIADKHFMDMCFAMWKWHRAAIDVISNEINS